MKNKHLLLAFILITLAFLAAGCSSKTGPDDIYSQYWEACSEGKFRDAEEFIATNARDTTRTLGACAFTHDAINTIEIANGNPLRTFSDEPEVLTKGDLSSITWFDDQGNNATVVLVKVDETWKIIEATWSR
jgi:hypothetical protein